MVPLLKISPKFQTLGTHCSVAPLLQPLRPCGTAPLAPSHRTTHPPATDRTDPRRNLLDQQRWAFDGSHCAGISAERVTTHVWLEWNVAGNCLIDCLIST
jgi:hypothetical protein